MVASPFPLVPPFGGPRGGTPQPRGIGVFGATGSIGRSALDVVRASPELFRVRALAAGRNEAALLPLVDEFGPRWASLDTPWSATASRRSGTEYLVGGESLCRIASDPSIDVVLAAVVGMAGLAPVLAALESGKTVALANKESLVMAGELVTAICERSGGHIVPVDSEHSALFQALQGSVREEVESLILTASGGPFLQTPVAALRSVTPAQALKHPRWAMGAKISIDSATMVNKALEVIEAAWLFGVPPERIRVVVHPQSIVHSVVEFVDGVSLAQLSLPDMKGPIAYALGYPHARIRGTMPRLSLTEVGKLEFMELDEVKFPAVRLGKAALSAGGAMAAVYSVANEVAVGAFLSGRLSFLGIVPMIEAALTRFSGAAYSDLKSLQAVSADVARWVTEQCST